MRSEHEWNREVAGSWKHALSKIATNAYDSLPDKDQKTLEDVVNLIPCVPLVFPRVKKDSMAIKDLVNNNTHHLKKRLSALREKLDICFRKPRLPVPLSLPVMEKPSFESAIGISTQTFYQGIQIKPMIPKLRSSARVQRTNGFSVKDLPDGLHANPDSGKITGVPAVVGKFDITWEAQNEFGKTLFQFHIEVIPAPSNPDLDTEEVNTMKRKAEEAFSGLRSHLHRNVLRKGSISSTVAKKFRLNKALFLDVNSHVEFAKNNELVKQGDFNKLLHFVDGKLTGEFHAVPKLSPPSVSLNEASFDATVCFESHTDARIIGYIVHSVMLPPKGQESIEKMEKQHFVEANTSIDQNSVLINLDQCDMYCQFAVQVVTCCGVGACSDWTCKYGPTPKDENERATALGAELDGVSEMHKGIQAFAESHVDKTEQDTVVQKQADTSVAALSKLYDQYTDVFAMRNRYVVQQRFFTLQAEAKNFSPMRSKAHLEKLLGETMQEPATDAPDKMTVAEFKSFIHDAKDKVFTCSLCSEMIKVKDQKQHQETSCPKAKTTCTQCKESVVREDMEEHKKVKCVYRLSKCPQCDNMVEHILMEDHKANTCDSRPMVCSFLCGQSILAKDMLNHKSSSCPKRRLKCSLCNENLLHADLMQEHVTESQTLMNNFITQFGTVYTPPGKPLADQAVVWFHRKGYNFCYMVKGRVIIPDSTGGCFSIGQGTLPDGTKMWCRKQGRPWTIVTEDIGWPNWGACGNQRHVSGSHTMVFS